MSKDLLKPSLLSLCLLPASLFAQQQAPHAVAVTEPIKVSPYQPPSEADIPDNEFGKMVKLGKKVFVDTSQYAGKYVGNKMR